MTTWTVQKLLAWSKEYFESWNVDTPLLDAQILLGHVLHMNRIQLMIDGARPMDENELAQYKSLIQRRAKQHEPIAYIIGHKEFWGLDFSVSSDVLIPRPDTECVVERALEFIQCRLKGQMPKYLSDLSKNISYETIDDRRAYYQQIEYAEKSQNIDSEDESELESAQNCVSDKDVTNDPLPTHNSIVDIVDVGTGSGAIALALASEIPPENRYIFAVDISKSALNIAHNNAISLNLTENIEFIEGNLLGAFNRQADIIISNPPYITAEEMTQLMPEVKCEPELALKAGKDGLDIYRRLIPQAYHKLKAGGMLIVEIGYRQSEAVMNLFKETGFGMINTFEDYGNNPRMVLGIRE